MVMPFNSVFMDPIKVMMETVGSNDWNNRTAAVLTKPATAPKATLIQ